MKYRTFVVTLAASLVVTGCSFPASTTPASEGLSSASAVTLNSSEKYSKPSTLYVLNSSSGKSAVVVYSGNGSKLLRTISDEKPINGFTVDSSGLLYVAEPQNAAQPSGPALLTVYAPGGKSVVRTIAQTHPFETLTVDSTGNLFALCAADRICEYASGHKPVTRRITLRKFGGSATALATDSNGNLATDATYGPIFVFAPGSTSPYWTIPSADYSNALNFDKSGNLYVVNSGSNEGDPGSVTVYASGQSTPMRTITDGIVHPSALAFDSSGHLYVLNYCVPGSTSGCVPNPSVTVYAPGGTSPIRTITQGIGGVGGIAVSADDILYVANSAASGTVTLYKKKSDVPSRTISNGITDPVGIAVRP